VLTMPAAADLIRTTVKNRFDNEPPGASVANHRRRRSDRSRIVLPPVACRGAHDDRREGCFHDRRPRPAEAGHYE